MTHRVLPPIVSFFRTVFRRCLDPSMPGPHTTARFSLAPLAATALDPDHFHSPPKFTGPHTPPSRSSKTGSLIQIP